MFAVKAPRYATNKRVLAEASPVIERFMASGLEALGDKLGPILWQFAPAKKFDAEDFAAFLRLLPGEISGRRQRHAFEVRHPSFAAPEFAAMARDAGAAVVLADSDTYPRIEHAGPDFVYARLMRNRQEVPSGYPADELAEWAGAARRWEAEGRDVFVYFIDGYKAHAPAAATSFVGALDVPIRPLRDKAD